MTDWRPKVWLGPCCLDEHEPKIEKAAADLAEALASVPNRTLEPGETEEDRARTQEALGRAYTSLWDVLQFYKEERRATIEARDEFLNEALASLKGHERALAEEQRESLKGRLLLKLERLGGVKEALAGGEMNAVLAASPPARAALMALFEHAGQAENVPPSEVRRRVDSGEWTTETIGRLPDTWVKPARLVTLACFCFWPAVLHEWRRDNAGNIAARWAIGQLGDNPLANRPDARSRLQAEVDRLLPGLRGALGLDNPENESAANLTALGADWFKQAGFTKTADALRRKAPAPDRWRDPLALAKDLALAVWAERIGPELESLSRLDDKHPAILIPFARALVGAGIAESIQAEDDGGLTMLWPDGQGAAHWPATAALTVAREITASPRLRSAVIAVATHLTISAYDRMKAGEPRFDYVPIPSGRDALRALFGGLDLSDKDIEAALDWLSGLKAGPWPCVAGHQVERQSPSSSGGRPTYRRIVHVGAPLAPYALDRIYHQAELTPPPELTWLVPVLPATHMPRAGNVRTRERQRAAFCLGLGAALIELRERYADRGGVELAELRRPLRDLGIYHRPHHSLLDDILDAWRTPPPPPLLPGMPSRPVLEETAPGTGIYRLGPDFRGAHEVVMGANRKTKDGRKKRAGKKKTQ